MATVFPTGGFDPEEAAQSLKKAMKGLGTDEDTIIEIIARHTNEERQQIADVYKTSYGEDLISELKSELRGNLEDVIIALMTPPRLYDAQQIRAAIKGLGTDEATLIEILCSRTPDQIEEIKQVYESEFDRNLEEDVQNDTSGDFRRLLVSQLNGGRDQNDDYDQELANDEAMQIYEAGEGQWGTDESTIMMILSLRSYAQLRATFTVYEKLSGKDIEVSIDNECSGSLRAGLLAIVRYAKDPATFFAIRLYESMKGLGTNDNDLIRAIVTRSEEDLASVKEAFFAKYGQPLSEFVASDVRGDYQKMLLSVIGD